MLDDPRVADVGLVGVIAVLPLGPSLAQKIPALVEHHLDVAQPLRVGLGALLTKAVLLVGE